MFVGFGIGKGERLFTRVRVMSYEFCNFVIYMGKNPR